MGEKNIKLPMIQQEILQSYYLYFDILDEYINIIQTLFFFIIYQNL